MVEWAQPVTGSCGTGREDPVLVEEGVSDDMGTPIGPGNVGEGHPKGIGTFPENSRASAAEHGFCPCDEGE